MTTNLYHMNLLALRLKQLVYTTEIKIGALAKVKQNRYGK